MTCTQQFWHFFKPLAQSVPGMKSVTRSGGDKMDRLLATSRTEELYPATFLLRPKYHVEDNGAGVSIAWYDATFFLICQGVMGELEDEDAAFDKAEQMATELFIKIQEQQDGFGILIDTTSKVYMEPVTLVTVDASYGYEVRFRVGLMVNESLYSPSTIDS